MLRAVSRNDVMSTLPSLEGGAKLGGSKSMTRPPPGFPVPQYCVAGASVAMPSHQLRPGVQEPVDLNQKWKLAECKEGLKYCTILENILIICL